MTAKKKLTTHVVLSHQGDVVTLGPDDDIPDWAKELIGDHCYADPEEDGNAGHADGVADAKPAAARRSSSAKS